MSHGARFRLERANETPEVQNTRTSIIGVGDARTRKAVADSGIRQSGKPQTMSDLWQQSVAEEKERGRRAAAEADARRKEHEERVRIAHENAKKRDAEYIAERDRLLEVARIMQAQAVESSLIQGQIQDICESHSLSGEQVSEIGGRLKRLGYHLIPAMWDSEARRYLEEKKHV